ncbi:MAG TPA: 2OG-Fe(II) oxygenase [Burkholderiales bacterium]|nr:2OG-Fe(II) oxygenase [Burkholderiales bacterium]
MSNPWTVLNAEALRKAALVTEPFPYLIVDNIIRPETLPEVVASFPRIDKRGSFPPEAVSYSGRFATLMQEMHSVELRDLVGERLGMDLKDRPPMLTVRGRTGKKDGQIHTDSKSKLVTVLLYLNSGWSAPEGRLRLLYNDHDLTRYAAEISPDAGRCLIFKVTPNCWHGHEPFDGERRTIQLNYVTSEEVRERERKRHRFSAFLKGLFSSKDAKSPAH